jgi:hypothetical protein
MSIITLEQAAHVPLTPTFHDWARLPAELKLWVLGYSLSSPTPIHAKAHSQHIVQMLMPLMSTTEIETADLVWEACKYQSTPPSGHHPTRNLTPPDYKNNRFLDRPTSTGYLVHLPRYLIPWTRGLVLSLHVEMFASSSMAILDRRNGLTFLIRPNYHLNHAYTTIHARQTELLNLFNPTTLEIDICLFMDDILKRYVGFQFIRR